MKLLSDINIWFACYMGATVISYVALIWLSKLADREYSRGAIPRAFYLRSLKRRAPGVTIIASAKNEASIIAESVRKLLSYDYPNLQVIVIDDGSTDAQLPILISQFKLRPEDTPIQVLPHEVVNCVWRSKIDPRLRVIEKWASKGSKGCGNNAALDITTNPYVFVTDVDSIIEPGTIEKMVVRAIMTDADAVGCPIRPMNDGNYWEIVQTLEYMRAFQFRQGWAHIGLLNNISGAAGLFRTKSLQAVGGYRIDTTAEDLGSTWKMLSEGMKLEYEPSVNVYTQVPYTFQSVKSQRKRWSRGLFDNLWFARNATVSKFGILAIWLWVFELLEPVVETAGLISITCTIIEGNTHTWFWCMLGLIALMASAISIVCIDQRERMSTRLTADEKLKLMLLAPIELFPFKIPLTLLWRLVGMVEYLNGDKSWKALPRQTF